MDSVGVFCVILFNGTFIRSFCVGNIFASVNVYFCSCSFGNFFWEEVLFLGTFLVGFFGGNYVVHNSTMSQTITDTYSRLLADFSSVGAGISF